MKLGAIRLATHVASKEVFVGQMEEPDESIESLRATTVLGGCTLLDCPACRAFSSS